MRPSRFLSGRRVRPIVLGAAVALVVVFAALLVVNLVVLPAIVTRVLAERPGRSAELSVARASYLPFVGITLRGTDVSFSDNAQASARRIRFRVPLGMSSLREWDPPSVHRNAFVSGVAEIITELSLMRAMPHRIAARGVRLELSRVSGRPLEFDEAAVIRTRSSGDLSFSAAGPSGNLGAAIWPSRDRGELVAGFKIPGWRGDAVTAGPVGVTVSVAATDRRYTITGSVEASDLFLLVPAISPVPVGPNQFDYEFRAIFNPGPVLPPPNARPVSENLVGVSSGSIAVPEASLTFNGLTANVEPSIDGVLGGPRSISLLASIERPALEALNAIPLQIAGELGQTRVRGALLVHGGLFVPLDSMSDLQWWAWAELSHFAVTAISEGFNVYKLNESLVHSITDTTGLSLRTVELPEHQPASMEWMLEHSEHSRLRILRRREEDAQIAARRPEVAEIASMALEAMARPPEPDPGYTYVRLDNMSPWIVRAVLTAEDGDFFFYRGVNPITLADAIEINLEAGEILYGASTISMQLAKMLFLDSERIFSRKLQELFLVYLMENEVPVPKDRILELYLNLAEFGPGIFGIADAAETFFGVTPNELDAVQATWLASILPAPKLYAAEAEDGEVSVQRLARMNQLYDIMLERGRMSFAEHQSAYGKQPVFTVPDPGV